MAAARRDQCIKELLRIKRGFVKWPFSLEIQANPFNVGQERERDTL